MINLDRIREFPGGTLKSKGNMKQNTQKSWQQGIEPRAEEYSSTTINEDNY